MEPGRFVAAVAVLVAAGILAPVSDARACSCATAPSACKATSAADAVFVGTVLDVTPDAVTERGAPLGPQMRVRLSVGETFRGAAQTTLVVATPSSAGACGVTFMVGESYLVYAHGTGATLSTNSCTRTTPLAAARNDLEILREMANGPVQSRLHGTALLLMSRMDGSPVPAIVGGVPRVTVVASSGLFRQTATTDELGEFRFLGLPPGRYTIRAEAAAPLTPMFQGNETVELDACSAEASIFLTAQSFTGTVTQANGSPAPANLPVTVIDAADGRAGRHTTVFTEDDGSWTLQGLGDGRYRIGINVREAPSASRPFAPTWYPGVTNVQRAEEIALVKRPRQVELTLPSPLPLRIIRGVVRDAAGQPVRGATVELFDEEFPKQSVARASAAADGTFSLESVAGRAVFVKATSFSRQDDTESDALAVPAAPGEVTVTLTLWRTASTPR